MAADEDRHIDGNGLAGVLAEVFGTDMTEVERRCADCGQTSVLAAHTAYRGAGYVLRCPGCDGVAMRIGLFDSRMTVTVSGVMMQARAG